MGGGICDINTYRIKYINMYMYRERLRERERESAEPEAHKLYSVQRYSRTLRGVLTPG